MLTLHHNRMSVCSQKARLVIRVRRLIAATARRSPCPRPTC